MLLVIPMRPKAEEESLSNNKTICVKEFLVGLRL